MHTKLDLPVVRVVVGIIAYLAMLGLVSIAIYALWAGPEPFGITEAWPLVSYFVVAYLSTLLVASGILVTIRFGPGLVREML